MHRSYSPPHRAEPMSPELCNREGRSLRDHSKPVKKLKPRRTVRRFLGGVAAQVSNRATVADVECARAPKAFLVSTTRASIGRSCGLGCSVRAECGRLLPNVAGRLSAAVGLDRSLQQRAFLPQRVREGAPMVAKSPKLRLRAASGATVEPRHSPARSCCVAERRADDIGMSEKGRKPAPRSYRVRSVARCVALRRSATLIEEDGAQHPWPQAMRAAASAVESGEQHRNRDLRRHER